MIWKIAVLAEDESGQISGWVRAIQQAGDCAHWQALSPEPLALQLVLRKKSGKRKPKSRRWAAPGGLEVRRDAGRDWFCMYLGEPWANL
jgi:hypothetical protein